MHRALFFLPGPVSPYGRRLWHDFLAPSWHESTQGKGLPQMIVALVAMAVLGLAGLSTLTQGISPLLFGAMGAVLAWMACTIARPTLWPTLLTARGGTGPGAERAHRPGPRGPHPPGSPFPLGG